MIKNGHNYRNALGGMLAMGIIAAIALGCTCNKGFDLSELSNKANGTGSDRNDPFGGKEEAMPDENLLKAIVKETTADFAYAISEDDFSKIYGKSAPELQKTYTEQQFKDTFSDFTRQKSTLLPILSRAVTSDPVYDGEPKFRTEKGHKILVVDGKYPTKPMPVTFGYEYVKRDGTWKLLVLKVYIR